MNSMCDKYYYRLFQTFRLQQHSKTLSLEDLVLQLKYFLNLNNPICLYLQQLSSICFLEDHHQIHRDFHKCYHDILLTMWILITISQRYMLLIFIKVFLKMLNFPSWFLLNLFFFFLYSSIVYHFRLILNNF